MEESHLLCGPSVYLTFHILPANLQHNSSVTVTERCNATALFSYISFTECLLVYYLLMTYNSVFIS